jgi:tRNA pseudouridine55 synthase
MSRRRPARWHGVLPVRKLPGPTSHDVVDMARKALRERRIGHTGTLDPMAEGLLLLCVGQATRLQQFFLSWEKSYRGLIRLGYATTTYDREGEVTDPRGEPPALDRSSLDRLEAAFSGEIEQTPPPFSAKKVAGKKLYELARDGHTVEADAKQVVVHELHLEVEDCDLVAVRISTSSGFYVRSFAHELGALLGCGGHLDHLERVQIGPYSVDRALSQAALESASSPDEIIGSPSWIPLEKVTLPFPDVRLNSGASERFIHGQEVMVFRSGTEVLSAETPIALRNHEGCLLGVGTIQHVLARGRTLSIKPNVVLAAR